MLLSNQMIKSIIRRLIQGEDYRTDVIALIDAQFLDFAIAFFKKVVHAKLSDESISIDWYKSSFLNEDLDANDIAIHAGLNKKTITKA